jgi:hypothetical protein
MENIALICRQTIYTEEEARQQLMKHEDNVECVIREYLGIVPTESVLSSHRKIHKFMSYETRRSI